MKGRVAVFKADLHVHTRSSFDSLSEPKDALSAALKRGLSAIAITDHNEIAGAMEAMGIARERKLKLQVIIGEEVATEQGDLLVYFLKKRIAPGPLEQVISEAKMQGAITCAAHPYDRARHGIRLERLAQETLARIDAIEAFNARVTVPSHNSLALKFAQERGKPILAGSDAHHPSEVGQAYAEFEGIGRLNRRSILSAPRRMRGRLSSALVHALSRYAALKRKLASLKRA